MKARKTNLVSRVILTAILFLSCSMAGISANIETTVNGIVFQIPDANVLECTASGYTAGLPADLVIPKQIDYDGKTYVVTQIKKSAFRKCSNLTSVVIPSCVKTVGGYAFYNCSNLRKVTISSKETNIGYCTFAVCPNINSVTLPVRDFVGHFGDSKNISEVKVVSEEDLQAITEKSQNTESEAMAAKTSADSFDHSVVKKSTENKDKQGIASRGNTYKEILSGGIWKFTKFMYSYNQEFTLTLYKNGKLKYDISYIMDKNKIYAKGNIHFYVYGTWTCENDILSLNFNAANAKSYSDIKLTEYGQSLYKSDREIKQTVNEFKKTTNHAVNVINREAKESFQLCRIIEGKSIEFYNSRYDEYEFVGDAPAWTTPATQQKSNTQKRTTAAKKTTTAKKTVTRKK